jgi:proteasome lid subunit RPN8/RPN11
MVNFAWDSGSFSICKGELQLIRKEAAKAGSRVVGLFHSHPIAEPAPGPRDIKEAPGNSLMLIYDVCGQTAALWRIKRRGGKATAIRRGLWIARKLEVEWSTAMAKIRER